jgi:dephospho-CoA kinase
MIFGKEIFDQGIVNRKAVAAQVFNNKEKLQSLNELIHPDVAKRFENWCSKQNSPYILKEAAILIESGSYKHLDKIILVTAPAEIRIARLKQRDRSSDEEIEKKMAAQLSDAEKSHYANYFIFNDEVQMLIPQVLAIHAELSAGK